MTLLRPRTWTLLAALLGGFATLLVLTLAQLDFAYRALGLHVALETAAGFVAFLVAHLVYGRFRQTGRIDDLVLTLSLGTIAFANFFFAAIAPGRRLANPPRTARIGMVACFALLLAVAVGMALAADHLPAGLDPTVTPGRADLLSAPVGIVAVQAVGILLYAAAAIGFTRRAEAEADPFMLFLAVGAALAAVARWNYLLYPSLYSPWVYTGDAFRLAPHLVFWFGAAREIGNYWRSRAEKAVLEERRRLARELHDGVAQELGFIAARAHELASTDAEARRIAAAAERGLDESRRGVR